MLCHASLLYLILTKLKNMRFQSPNWCCQAPVVIKKPVFSILESFPFGPLISISISLKYCYFMIKIRPKWCQNPTKMASVRLALAPGCPERRKVEKLCRPRRPPGLLLRSRFLGIYPTGCPKAGRRAPRGRKEIEKRASEKLSIFECRKGCPKPPKIMPTCMQFSCFFRKC